MGGVASMVGSATVEATAGTILSGVFSSITGKYEMQEGLDEDLFRLDQKLLEIRSAIDEARRRRIINQHLLDWLATLINVAILGDFTRSTLKNQNSPCSMITCEGTTSLSVSPSYRVPKRRRSLKTFVFGDMELKELYRVLGRLESSNVFSFIKLVCAQPEISRPVNTYLFMDHSRIFGREKERAEVMDFLLKPNISSERNVDVLSIVGCEGVGKATLALHCFYDPKVQTHFSRKFYMTGWFGPDIIREILKQCSNSNITHHDDNTLLVMLKQNLSSERFCLILEWCDDSRIWKDLWDCLRCGKEGSKVIIIETFDDYNSVKETVNVGRVKPLMLDTFPEDEYWLFFKEHAFGTADPEDFPRLAKIGEEIAEMMNGSIWGAKVVGELLRDNMNALFWTKVRDDVLSSPETLSPDLWSVTTAITQLLPPVPDGFQMAPALGGSWPMATADLRSFKELMVLSPNHLIEKSEDYRRLIEKSKDYILLPVVVGVDVFKSEHVGFHVEIAPTCDKNTIHFEEDLKSKLLDLMVRFNSGNQDHRRFKELMVLGPNPYGWVTKLCKYRAIVEFVMAINVFQPTYIGVRLEIPRMNKIRFEE